MVGMPETKSINRKSLYLFDVLADVPGGPGGPLGPDDPLPLSPFSPGKPNDIQKNNNNKKT